ncbi:CheY-like chemotaxis protein [Devosia sp. UYZn731]|uniref:ATP-binding response regulator n=1 Tax=Devosia sp. UYZn731 TaxID=3156345 RepID=UPI003399FB89
MGALAKFRRLVSWLASAVAHVATRLDRRRALVEEIARQRATIDTLGAAKAAAERANAAKSDFLAQMSREMRVPLNALLSYSGQLLDKAELEGKGEALADLEKIRAAGQHVLVMVNDILDISRIETAKTWPHLLNVDKGQQPSVPMVLHRGPSLDEQAFLDEIDAETSAPNVAADALVIDDERERLLVVDDDRNFLELAKRLFLKEGYAPICTDAPQSALQIARTVKPAAIFLDILMPGFDGWDVLAALKSDPATAAIPVFMISILSDRMRALAAGADGVVTKPLDAARVKAAITGLKARRGSGKPAGRATGR